MLPGELSESVSEDPNGEKRPRHEFCTDRVLRNVNSEFWDAG